MYEGTLMNILILFTATASCTLRKFSLCTTTHLLLLLCFASVTHASGSLNKRAIENTIDKALETFQTPGMSVGIIHKNKVVLAKGYGSANLETNLKANAQTYFRLASVSKAFTSAALAILVDEEKINWNDKVINYLPEFQLYDPYVTREFTILDLLTHRSGLLSGAGDSMIWPEPSGFSRQEVIENLRYLSPEYSFRARYAYSNVMYISAGELVAKVSGMSFENFVEQRIFKHLGMDCFVGDIPKISMSNVAMGYAHNNERGIYPVSRNAITTQGLMSAAAGGMVCNAQDMLKWLGALLSRENLPFTESQLDEMWYPQTILGVSKLDKQWDNTLYKNYGLGWRLANVGELEVISHTGTLSGYQAYALMVPKLELGVIILNNGSNSAARGAVMQSIVKSYMQQAGYKDEKQKDWIVNYIEYLDEREQAYLAKLETPVASAPMSITNEQILGEYKDKWFGSFLVESISNVEQNNTPIIRISSNKMSTLKGTLVPFQDATYKIEWDNKNAASDAFMHFRLNVKREITSATLHPFSVDEIINHEYRDMEFIKVVTKYN
jgi:CubicO group peptidase (beta-lactamase class C family)